MGLVGWGLLLVDEGLYRVRTGSCMLLVELEILHAKSARSEAEEYQRLTSAMYGRMGVPEAERAILEAMRRFKKEPGKKRLEAFIGDLYREWCYE